MIDYYIGLSGGLKASLVITAFLMISTSIIGLRVKRMKTSDLPGGIVLVAVVFVYFLSNWLCSKQSNFTKYWSAQFQ